MYTQHIPPPRYVLPFWRFVEGKKNQGANHDGVYGIPLPGCATIVDVIMLQAVPKDFTTNGVILSSRSDLIVKPYASQPVMISSLALSLSLLYLSMCASQTGEEY